MYLFDSEDNAPMCGEMVDYPLPKITEGRMMIMERVNPDIDPNKNCHSYCRYGKQCRYLDGGNGVDPDNCGMYYKIDDIMFEAREMAREDKMRREEEDGEDW